MFQTGYIYLDLYLIFILIVKICILTMIFFRRPLINRGIFTSERFYEIKHQLEFLFNISMSILLIILFNPLTEKYLIITHHIKLFLFVFGVLNIINMIKENF
jgi:hypothetical protein